VDRFKEKNAKRERRHKRVCRKVQGTSDKPRLCVFRSNSNIYCQLVDDEKQCTILHASTMEKDVREKLPKRGNRAAAKEIGKRIAEKAKTLGITRACFDRAGYKYHGRVKELADAAREGGLKF
jgi:large subunit ribosomal protein L18